MYSTHEWTQMQVADELERLYRKVSILGWLGRIGAALRGRPTRLTSLAEATAARAFEAQRHGGRETVALDAILGSEGRSDDFDAAFRPLRSHTRQRWVSLATAWRAGASLPPVELIRVGDAYFVRDGHHRISVARAFGHRAIEANVTIWQLAQPPVPASTPHEPVPSTRRAQQYPQVGEAIVAQCVQRT